MCVTVLLNCILHLLLYIIVCIGCAVEQKCCARRAWHILSTTPFQCCNALL